MIGQCRSNQPSSRNQRPVFIIAGGGTGGHLFPGIAIAKELETRFDSAQILFVVGRKRMEPDILSRYGYKELSIDVEGLKGRGWWKGANVLLRLPKSVIQSASIIKGYSPCLVLGMGGYSAGPVCLAAKLKRIPTAIHEQNSYPGLTNRLLCGVVDRIFISFEESRVHFKKGKLCLTGNPVRNELFSKDVKKAEDQGRFTILIVGGSQGARAINDAFAEALEHLNRKGRDPLVIHQTGDSDYERVVEDYRRRGIDGEVAPFIQDMATAYNRADVVVSRAGATTVFELAALGKPSIMIPYPYAANQHQKTNAQSMVQGGCAEMILQQDLTGEYLARILMKYMDDQSLLIEMGKRARNMGQREAAKLIVDQLAGMIQQ